MSRARKPCAEPGCRVLVLAGTTRCDDHKRPTAAQRGYGHAHQTLRARWQRRIDKGEVILCARGCGTRITGRAWDLGHTDDRAAYSGPECMFCNRSAGGKAAHVTLSD